MDECRGSTVLLGLTGSAPRCFELMELLEQGRQRLLTQLRRPAESEASFSARDPSPNFPMIAHQLELLFPPSQTEVNLALQVNPDVGYSSMSYQRDREIVSTKT